MHKVLGIVAEYNPFHNGHLYHLQKSKELSGCDYSVCVMSGNFIQRGNTAIIDKWARAKMALLNGIDLVIELPTIYAISSAENFAYGAISILNSIGVDIVSFGSEHGNLSALTEVANVLYTEPNAYVNLLDMELKKGVSFPTARESALKIYLNDSSKSNILENPNNILGIEYIKAIKRLNSSITPITIQREYIDYNQNGNIHNFASATGIRNMLISNKVQDIKHVVPVNVFDALLDKLSANEIVTDITTFEKEIFYALRTMSVEQIANLPDVSEGLEYCIKKAVNSSNNILELIHEIKSKRYTMTRVQRILLYAMLNISKTDMQSSFNTTPYVRILGMNKNGKKLLSNKPGLHIVTSPKKSLDLLEDSVLKNMLEKDILTTNIYTLGYNGPANLDYTNKLIVY